MATWQVSRVSARWGSTEPPCEEAVVTGQKQIARDTFVPVYSVSLNTLEEVMAFIDKHGEIILYPEELIIYDDHIA